MVITNCMKQHLFIFKTNEWAGIEPACIVTSKNVSEEMFLCMPMYLASMGMMKEMMARLISQS